MSNKTNVFLCDVSGWLLFGLMIADVIAMILGRVELLPGIVGFVLLVFLCCAVNESEKRYREKVAAEKLVENSSANPIA